MSKESCCRFAHLQLIEMRSLSLLLVLLCSVHLLSAQKKPHVTCERTYEKVGCFPKVGKCEDSLGKLLFSDRENLGHVGSSGHVIDWKNPDEYLHSLACRCNDAAISDGDEYFSLFWYGLCYGSNSPPDPATKLSSDKCINGKSRGWNHQCSYTDDKECVGNASFHKVYRVGSKVDGGFSQWTAYGACSKSCGGGVRSRQRSCNNPAPAHGGRECVGPRTETQACKNDLCPGPAGVSQAQQLVGRFLHNYHDAVFPDKQKLGKFDMAISRIQEAVAQAFQTETSEESLETRLGNLTEFLNVAANGGSIDFAQSTLGTSLFVFIKKKIEEGLPIDDLDRAARGYLNYIRNITDSKFNDILLVNSSTTLMFAIDTTFRMKEDIDAVKAVAEHIIRMKRDFPVNFLLSPFDERGEGTVQAKNSTEAIEFISAIQNLVLGGAKDCHKITFKGMNRLLSFGPKPRSPMFVFADAGPREDKDRKRKQLSARAKRFGSPIIFFTRLGKCSNSSGIESFREVAAETSGSVFTLASSSELMKYKDFIGNSLENENTIAQATINTESRKRSGSNNYEIQVDEEMKSLIVSVNVQRENVGNWVELVDRAGRTYFAQSSTRFAKVFNIKNPDPGTWSLRYRFGIGEVAFTADAVSDKPLDFYYYFNHQEKPSENSPVMTLPNPIEGRKASMAVRVSHVELLDPASMKIDIVDEHGSVLVGNVAANRMGGGAFEASFDPPSSQFKVMLKGRTTKGRSFQRLSNRFSKVEKIVMVAISAGDEFTASATRGASTVRVYVYNSGFVEYLQFSGSASRGSISGSNQYFAVKKGEGKIFELHYTVNRSEGPHVGKTDTIYITASNPSRQKMISINVLIVE